MDPIADAIATSLRISVADRADSTCSDAFARMWGEFSTDAGSVSKIVGDPVLKWIPTVEFAAVLVNPNTKQEMHAHVVALVVAVQGDQSMVTALLQRLEVVGEAIGSGCVTQDEADRLTAWINTEVAQRGIIVPDASLQLTLLKGFVHSIAELLPLMLRKLRLDEVNRAVRFTTRDEGRVDEGRVDEGRVDEGRVDEDRVISPTLTDFVRMLGPPDGSSPDAASTTAALSPPRTVLAAPAVAALMQ